jgi:probable rRNA maturation factor
MRELQLRNRQRKKTLDTDLLRGIVRSLLEEELHLTQYAIAIQFIGSTKMAALNEQFLDHEGSTDVITFDYGQDYNETEAARLELAGEIFISVPDAIKQAREFSTKWEEELVRYAVHGILHLLGYDDLAPRKRIQMKRAENRLVRRLAKRFSLRRISV